MSLFSRQQIRILSSTSLLLLGLQSGVFASEEQLKIGISPQGLDKLILAQNNDVLVPNPRIRIDGQEVNPRQQQNVPPLRPRAVAPPVGDMSISDIDIVQAPIILPSNPIIPNLVLRDAPLDEVLKILARAAGASVMFDYGKVEEGAETAKPSVLKRPITIDLQNEPVQDVFNNLIKLNRLEAHLKDKTLFIGENLPYAATGAVTKTIRVNQARAVTLAAQLALMGATVQEVVEILERVENENGVLIRTISAGRSIKPLTANTQDNDKTPLPLRRLNVTADERANSITLTGTTEEVRIATNYIVQSDVRLRQAVVNVKIIDVDLIDGANSFNSSFSVGIGDVGIVQGNGRGAINFGNSQPSTTFGVPDNSTSPLNTIIGNPFNIPKRLLAQIDSSVRSGNGKILSDPTIIVQEGQTGEIALVEKVITRVITTPVVVEPDGTRTGGGIEPEFGDVGLTLNLNIDKIDDNGFISMIIAPKISTKGETQLFNSGAGAVNQITLLKERTVSSGLIRVRDGQTVILSGIIQDEERVEVNKVPIFGDLPLIGSLFRKSTTNKSRSEVIVLVTPNILDDSEASSASGYNYNPSPQTQEFLQEKGVNIPGSGIEATPQQ